jgi:hypothetical protein
MNLVDHILNRTLNQNDIVVGTRLIVISIIENGIEHNASVGDVVTISCVKYEPPCRNPCINCPSKGVEFEFTIDGIAQNIKGLSCWYTFEKISPLNKDGL